MANKNFTKWVNYNLNASSDKNSPYEVVGINKPWNEDLDKYVQNIIDKEDGVFMNKLTLNALDQSAFKLNKIGVKAYDVSDDYEKYAQCAEAKKHIPVLLEISIICLIFYFFNPISNRSLEAFSQHFSLRASFEKKIFINPWTNYEYFNLVFSNPKSFLELPINKLCQFLCLILFYNQKTLLFLKYILLNT